MRTYYSLAGILLPVLLMGTGCIRPNSPLVPTAPLASSTVTTPPIVPVTTTSVACTQEAKQCPDGSYVGRIGPDCQFAPCPMATSSPVGRKCSGPNDTSCGPGYLCIEACGPPIVREGDLPPGYICETEEVAKKPRVCPICLAVGTLIATPRGPVAVEDIAVGDTVWSLSKAGEKIATRVIKTGHTPVPLTHQVVHLVLTDGREVWVSPQHPTITGQTVGSLKPGDTYDGSTVLTAILVFYDGQATYDILPDSATGYYLANGIWLGSTLKP